MINGNIEGIKESLLEEIEGLYDLRCARDEFISREMMERLADYSCQLNREISVFLSRRGRVLDVSVGSNESVSLPSIRKRRGFLGLSGVRCIHTHPGGSPMLSSVDVGTLLSSRLDSMAALSVKNGRPGSLCAGFIGKELDQYEMYGPFRADRIPGAALMAKIEAVTQQVAELVRLQATREERERAMLIGLNSTEESMRELALLADTAGAEVAASFIQSRPRDKGYYIGRGKARELSLQAAALDVDLAIFDDELTPIETKNLEEILGVKIVDRTTLILDIFARHARTKEGKLQVELAQLKYNLPQLIGEGAALSRLGGGIGTRGPGESKLEVDRRRIHRRIFELEKEIARLSEQRSLRREVREKNAIKEVALVGYTNAGKSSLLNALSGADVYAEDKLFATLDPVTRKAMLPSGKEALFTDTVGFIDKLPHELVSAFRSTLEEVARADLLLLVVDVSDPRAEAQIQVVRDVLESLHAGGTPTLLVYNKIDRLETVPANTPQAVYISAKEQQGLSGLLERVEEMLRPRMMELTLDLGYDEGAKLAFIQKHAEELSVEYDEAGMHMHIRMPASEARKLLR